MQANGPHSLALYLGLARMDNPAGTVRQRPNGGGVGFFLRDARLEGQGMRLEHSRISIEIRVSQAYNAMNG
jgi:hypothetical protein